MKKFVISLDRTPQRWANFRDLNKELSAFRFSAIDGKLLTKEQLAAEGLIEPDLSYSPGALGCLASHVALWKKAAELNEPIMVLEDDAVAHQDIELLFYRLRESMLVGWDYLALGVNMDCPIQFDMLPGVTPGQMAFLPKDIATGLRKFKSLDLRPVAYRLQMCFGTPGYIVSPAGAHKLLSKILPVKNFRMTCSAGHADNCGIDVALNAAYPHINAYVSMPPLVITPNDKSVSTVQGS